MMKRLKEMEETYEHVGNVRGIGLMIGVEIVTDKKTGGVAEAEREFILHKAYENGLVMLGAGHNVVRICPPLVITKAQADKGLDILENAIKMLHERKS
jgi:4-aminobutyrate aminotransferase